MTSRNIMAALGLQIKKALNYLIIWTGRIDSSGDLPQKRSSLI